MTNSSQISATQASTGARHFILGTAGHIDHGKTSLVKALTGVNTDRLPEEQRRGMTIELGFAELAIDDVRFGVVDVPGHERFVRTMVAGATGIDMVLLVVAADDSVMPQTIEHVAILKLLGIERGLVAITKIDAVDPEMVDLVEADIRELLANSPLADAPICRVSSITGEGINDLKNAILQISRSLSRTTPSQPFRMAIDRVFTVQGRGTVVTGSVLRGRVSKGDTLELWPVGATCRVRDLQTHGDQQELLERGQRAAINLSGADKESIERGFELATPGYLTPTRLLEVSLSSLGSLSRPVKSNSTARLEMGTNETTVRVTFIDQSTLQAGERCYAQLHTREPVTAAFGQRFILRDENSSRTIGGGIVLKPVALRRRRKSQADNYSLGRLDRGDERERLEEVIRTYGFRRPTDMQVAARTGIELEQVPTIMKELETCGRLNLISGTNVRATPGQIADVIERLTTWLERYHKAHPELPGRPADSAIGWLERITGDKSLARPLFAELLRAKSVKAFGRFVCATSFAPSLSQNDEKFLNLLQEEFRARAFQPPALAELSFAPQIDRKRLDRLITLAVAMGELVPIDSAIYLHTEHEQELRHLVARLIGEHGSVTVAQIREAMKSSRKYAVPIVEYLDRVGFTRREGDLRVLKNSGNS
ncbi:MAG: selenocysteine-specific translation elongation factor [Planctomycetes bacterium]|nr:selenocysteine-specific translation elongation factor [Planctomycetota bacterium]MBI3835394.1 selenocysteine-specific translation elongation factor [Planctomycetota bacterium]